MRSIRSAAFRTAFIGFLAMASPKYGYTDCSLTSTGITPVNDLWSGFYQGLTGGLYPNGINLPPPDHLAAGIELATSQIRPLDASGNYDPVGGRIVMISVG